MHEPLATLTLDDIRIVRTSTGVRIEVLEYGAEPVEICERDLVELGLHLTEVPRSSRFATGGRWVQSVRVRESSH